METTKPGAGETARMATTTGDAVSKESRTRSFDRFSKYELDERFFPGGACWKAVGRDNTELQDYDMDSDLCVWELNRG